MAEKLGFGVDIGGSGIKGGVVDMETGELVGERYKVLTPQPSTPEACAEVVREVIDHFDWTGPVGVTVPAVVTKGTVRSAANIDPGWIGTDADALFTSTLNRAVTVLNDADAAGLAEDRYGAGRDFDGVILLLTLGTGIGSALLHRGTLVPNTEFGHIEVDGKEAEHRAASSVKERKEWSYERWAKEVSRVFQEYEKLLWPDLIIVGGGVSRKADKWVPLLDVQTPVIPAKLQNTAGIVGAAMASQRD
ncbi:polyphosphate glucokinase [Tsukamurella pulmonis]|uniref:Polyphosphate glucokinase n=1 Tax=Tsukamurella pulmonis TaxID=47312 RepID=A0A1H1ECV7_9ACTN|nr:ROK family protein [Tsukamurella pulmonis]KXO91988.1 polyphosphate glucokinase [Tsukamurella pulmonis]KXP09639.1 polyphosphate glucokinase [Tsukamurella pulmonis]RDH09423.1 ROK family protein [Tsukamurella pulmonis]SDQ86563.1 polyphosphate glucokinase [Tsukamurella pulmonis]SUP21033.1 Polyphosphate glucokinase [Tsukamurella pulmonis]